VIGGLDAETKYAARDHWAGRGGPSTRSSIGASGILLGGAPVAGGDAERVWSGERQLCQAASWVAGMENASVMARCSWSSSVDSINSVKFSAKSV